MKGDNAAWLCRQLLFSGIVILHTAAVNAAAQEETEAEDLLPAAVSVAPDETTVVGLDEYEDPLESFNRTVFKFNDVFYTYMFVPLGNAYNKLPSGPRQGVSRVFLNIREPLNMVNHAVQGKLRHAGRNAFRFLTNTTLGIGGIFDPAQNWFGVEPGRTGFNDTFQQYGVSSGPYIVLPFIGGTNIRGGVGSVLDSTLHPIRMVTEDPETTYLMVFDNFQRFAPQAQDYLDLRDETDDPYSYFRNQYLQGVARDADFGNGETTDP